MGKDKQGISTHIKAKKRAEEAGLGQEKVLAAEMGDTWWSDSLEKTMYKMRMKKKLEKKARKLEKKAKKQKGSKAPVTPPTEEELLKGYVEKAPPTAEELFEATGGARFGMRAQSKQKGKWARSEGDAIAEDVKNLVQVEWDGLGKVDVSEIVRKDQEKKEKEKLKLKKRGRKEETGTETGEKKPKVENADSKADSKADKKKRKEKKEKKEKREKKKKNKR